VRSEEILRVRRVRDSMHSLKGKEKVGDFEGDS
jgi:hypothetical protein